jgi:hypothetical protein
LQDICAFFENFRKNTHYDVFDYQKIMNLPPIQISPYHFDCYFFDPSAIDWVYKKYKTEYLYTSSFPNGLAFAKVFNGTIICGTDVVKGKDIFSDESGEVIGFEDSGATKIVGLDAQTGERLWEKSATIPFESIIELNGFALLRQGQENVIVNPQNGKEVLRTKSKIIDSWGNKCFIQENGSWYDLDLETCRKIPVDCGFKKVIINSDRVVKDCGLPVVYKGNMPEKIIAPEVAINFDIPERIQSVGIVESPYCAIIANDIVYISLVFYGGHGYGVIPSLQCYDLKANKQLWSITNYPNLTCTISDDFKLKFVTWMDVFVFDLFTGNIDFHVTPPESPDFNMSSLSTIFDSDGNYTVQTGRRLDSMESYLVVGKVLKD